MTGPGPVGRPGHRPLGRTGIVVSEVGLGTVELGLDYGIPARGGRERPTRAEAVRFVRDALELGIDTFDTAPVYGESESILGEALEGRRDGVVVMTKVTVPDGLEDHRALTATIDASVEASLRALRTDVLDVVQLHNADARTITRGAARAALARHRDVGRIRAIGATTYEAEASRAVIDDGGFDVLQVALNLLDRTAAEIGLLEDAAARGIAVVARSVVLRGVLTARRTHVPASLAALGQAVDELVAIVGDDDDALPQAAFRYVLGLPAVACALIGSHQLAELRVAIDGAAAGRLAPEALAGIRGVTVADPRQLDPRTWPPDTTWDPAPAVADDQDRSRATRS